MLDPRRRLLAVAVLLLVTTGTTACGSGASPDATASTGPTASPPPSAEPSESAQEPSADPPPVATPPAPAPSPAFDRARLSIDDPTSIWVVTDKLRPLNPLDYVPGDLVDAAVPYVSNPQMRAEAAAAISAMFAAATAEGAGVLQIQNAYRSFSLQTSVHDRLVASLGAAAADAQSARPGFSEHQTGLTADVVGASGECSIDQCFGQTPEGLWIAANSWRFGYIVRYPEGKQDVTGYIYEPWHVRYVGTDLAREMHDRGITTLEEFFELPAAPDYAG